jgi:hypothetical protein
VTHYEVLGVGRKASTSEIRAAFRALARAHHPDTSASGSAESLAPINEAWRVLGDSVLRYEYDRSIDRQADADNIAGDVADWSQPHTPGPALVTVPESSFPWRFLAVLTAIGIGVVLLGVFTYAPSNPPPPDNVLQTGSCVVIEENRDASEVTCDTDHDGVVERLLTADDLCPADTEPHRDSQGLGVVCVRFDV